jgi:hypothetical protein
METTERVRKHGDEITVTEKSWGQEEKVWFSHRKSRASDERGQEENVRDGARLAGTEQRVDERGRCSREKNERKAAALGNWKGVGLGLQKPGLGCL